MLKRILGEQFGVEFKQRGHKDNHICIQLLNEDDENWFDKGKSFSSYWIDDLIQVLNLAKAELESKAKKDKKGWGYVFRFKRDSK